MGQAWEKAKDSPQPLRWKTFYANQKEQKQVSREDLNAYQTLEKYFQQITHNDFIQEGKK